MHIAQIMGEMHLPRARPHVQMCPLFRIVETTKWIVLKFDVWLEIH